MDRLAAIVEIGLLSDEKHQELETDPSAQIDTDADSIQKGSRHYFGYKAHIGMDLGSKLIRRLSFRLTYTGPVAGYDYTPFSTD